MKLAAAEQMLDGLVRPEGYNRAAHRVKERNGKRRKS
jgi:hypothetical protein